MVFHAQKQSLITACEVGAMTAIFPVQIDKNSCYCTFCQDMIKTYQRETILFEFGNIISY